MINQRNKSGQMKHILIYTFFNYFNEDSMHFK